MNTNKNNARVTSIVGIRINSFLVVANNNQMPCKLGSVLLTILIGIANNV